MEVAVAVAGELDWVKDEEERTQDLSVDPALKVF